MHLATPKFDSRDRIPSFVIGFPQAQEQMTFQVECVLCLLFEALGRAKIGSKVIDLSGSFTRFYYFIFWLSPSCSSQSELF